MFPDPFDDGLVHIKTKVGLVYTFLIVANAIAWGWAIVAFSGRPALLSAALLAYTFGLRHAFDADHIAAIDNVVRKLLHDGKHPFSVGFFFSLGHSTIVVLASLAIAATATALNTRLGQFHDIGGMIGTAVSALFLFIIGIINLFILKSVWAVFCRVRRGGPICDADLNALLGGRGLLAYMFRPIFLVVSCSWQMYPIGFLFGLGFDTATEIGLLGISATQAAQGTSVWTILVFPALFTAGMSLMDTTDSVLMAGAYGWAFINPIRKLWYNLTLTAASVIVAIFVGGAEALGLIADKLSPKDGFCGIISNLNDNFGNVGFGVVGIFVLAWIISTMVYRFKGYDTLRVDIG